VCWWLGGDLSKTSHRPIIKRQEKTFWENWSWEPEEGLPGCWERSQPYWNLLWFLQWLKNTIAVVTLLFYVVLQLKFSSHYICWESFLHEELPQAVFLKTKKQEMFSTFVFCKLILHEPFQILLTAAWA
jgi:hypothetical protein